MKLEAHIASVQSHAKDCLEPSEMERNKAELSPRDFGGHVALRTP